jgi:hypothetical protein
MCDGNMYGTVGNAVVRGDEQWGSGDAVINIHLLRSKFAASSLYFEYPPWRPSCCER